LREEVLRRLRSGEKAPAIAAKSGISRSTVYRWKRETTRAATKPPAARRSSAVAAAAPVEGYVCDMTGPGITDKWG
jgi:transposase